MLVPLLSWRNLHHWGTSVVTIFYFTILHLHKQKNGITVLKNVLAYQELSEVWPSALDPELLQSSDGGCFLLQEVVNIARNNIIITQ